MKKPSKSKTKKSAPKKQVAKKAKKSLDDFLLKVGPSIQAQISKLQHKVEDGVSKVGDLKNLGLQILRRSVNTAESISKNKKKKKADK